MIADKDPYIKSAFDQLQFISQDKQKRLEYETREKAIRDHNQLLFEATQRGIEIGEQRGEQRGIEIGEQRGIEIGEQRGIEIGEQRVNKLNMLLLQNNRYDDLKRSAGNPNFQQQLMTEYGI